MAKGPAQKQDVVAVELRERLRNGDLYSIAELRTALQFVVNQIAIEAKDDFEHMFYLNRILYSNVPHLSLQDAEDGAPVEILPASEYVKRVDAMVKGLEIQWEKPIRYLQSRRRKETPLASEQKMRELVIQLHVSLLKIMTLARAQAADRKRVIRALFAELEAHGIPRARIHAPDALPV